jgi:hypothetical protein
MRDATDILIPLLDLLAANQKLHIVLDHTTDMWFWTDKCWIDQLNEPTIDLQKHRLPRG